MSVILRFSPVNNLLGLRIDKQSDDGTDSPSMIVIFREQGPGPVGPAGTGIDDDPVEDEAAPPIEHGRPFVDLHERPV